MQRQLAPVIRNSTDNTSKVLMVAIACRLCNHLPMQAGAHETCLADLRPRTSATSGLARQLWIKCCNQQPRVTVGNSCAAHERQSIDAGLAEYLAALGGSYIVVEQPRGVKQGCETSHVDYQELTSM